MNTENGQTPLVLSETTSPESPPHPPIPFLFIRFDAGPPKTGVVGYIHYVFRDVDSGSVFVVVTDENEPADDRSRYATTQPNCASAHAYTRPQVFVPSRP